MLVAAAGPGGALRHRDRPDVRGAVLRGRLPRRSTRRLTLAQTTQGAAGRGAAAPATRSSSVNGTPVDELGRRCSSSSTRPTTRRRPGDVVHFVVRRGGEDLTIPVTLQESTDPAPKRVDRGRVAARRRAAARASSPSIVAGAEAGRRHRLGCRSRRSAACSRPRGSRTTSASSPATRAATPTRRSGSSRRSASARRRERRGEGRLGQRVRAADRDQHLRRAVQPAPAAALRRRAHRDRALRDASRRRSGGAGCRSTRPSCCRSRSRWWRCSGSSSCRACSSTSPTRSRTRSEPARDVKVWCAGAVATWAAVVGWPRESAPQDPSGDGRQGRRSAATRRSRSSR